MADEKRFEEKIKAYLKSINAWEIKYWGGAKFTKSGIPDILSCVNGFFVAIEVKGPNGHPTNLQLYQIREIRKAGGIAFVLYPKQFGKFKELCGALKGGMWSKADDLQYEIDEILSLKDKEVLYDKNTR